MGYEDWKEVVELGRCERVELCGEIGRLRVRMMEYKIVCRVKGFEG